MKFTISTQELNYLINRIHGVVSAKATMPVLGNILIEAYNDELILSATDLTVGIRCFTDAKISEEGSTTLPAKKFAQLIRELTVTNVEISSNPNEITTIIAGSSRFKLNGMNKAEFPSFPDMSSAHSFKIKQNELKALLYHTAFAVSKEDNRYTLTGVFMQIANGVATFMGTDGKRLARVQTAIGIDPDLVSQSIIPLKAVDEIIKCLSEEGEATVYLMSDKIGVSTDNTHLVTKLLSGQYPDLTQVIPQHCEKVVALHREELMSLLRQIILFIPDQQHPVRFIFTEGDLQLSSNATDVGEGNVSMPVNYQGEPLEMAFNPVYFLDFLRHCDKESVSMGLIDAYNPAVITDQTQLSHTASVSPLFVIMPMRAPES